MGEIRSTTVLTLEDIQSQLSEEERLLIFATNKPPYFVKGLSSLEAKINDEFQLHVQGRSIRFLSRLGIFSNRLTISPSYFH